MQPQQNENSYLPIVRSFDQKPIGLFQKPQEMSEYPPDFNPNNMNMDTKPQPLPLGKRLHSKVWKIRKEAFQQLLAEVNDKGQTYQQYLKDTVQFITDANPMCQQRALRVLLKYLQTGRKNLDDPKTIMKALIEKCLVVQKGQSSNLATEIMFWFMDNYSQMLLNEVNENILNKNPKIAASVLSFLQKLLDNYGAKKLKQFQQFNKNFTLLSSSVRPVAKQQTIGFFKQMYKWMGDATFGFNMHPQVKEQVTKFSKTYVKEPMIIKRGLNQEQKKGKKPITESADDDQNEQPQDVLIAFDSRWVDKIFQQTKWKEKKSLLDQFIKKTKVKNIVPRQNTHYIALIKRLLSDNNINLLQCGFKVVKNLCNGLKKNFTHPSKVVLQLIFSKLRDNKAMIVDQTQQTLDSMMNSIYVDDMIQQIKEGLKDKAPNMRFQTLKFIEKLIIKKDKKMMGAFKNLTLQIVDLNQDGASQVRDKALDVLCKLKAVYGLNFFGDKLKKIQGKKLQAIQNYIDPNLDKKQDQPIQQQQSQAVSKTTIPSKKTVKTYSPQSLNYQNPQMQPQNSSKQSIITEPALKVSPFSAVSQFQSPNENTRFLAYQTLSLKSHQAISNQLLQSFKNKAPMIRQSNPTILKLILACVKKSVQSTVGMEHMELLMYHDWKKCKQLLVQFVQTSKLNLMALQFVKNSGLLQTQNGQSKRNQQIDKSLERELNNSNPQHINIHNGTNHVTSSHIITHPTQPTAAQALKTFYSSIPSLIPKISNPDPNVRLQSVQIALDLLKLIAIGVPLQSTSQPTPAIVQSMSQFFNVLKYRIQDSNEQICNNYINLINQMLTKGFLTKYRTPGRLIISTLLQKINNPRLSNLTLFIKEMVTNHAVILWQFLVTQLHKQNMCIWILNVIKGNNQSFFKYADQKSYILPLITCIAKDLQGQKCAELLDQIVEINGEQILQKIAKESKITGFSLDSYLKKWNIHINSNNNANNHEKSKLINNSSIMMNSTFAFSKLQRLSTELQNPWPLTPSPPHILKMLTQMMNLGQPFHSFASPILLTEQQLATINNLRNEILEDYSDILTRWVFWRVHIQGQSKNIQTLLELVYRIINLGFELHQSQIVTILGSLISCLSLHKLQYIRFICKINSYLNQHPLYKQKSFRFWINSFNDPTAPVDQILNLIINSCSDMIPSELVTLARYPAVTRNKQFNSYLRSNYTQKLLTVYGFKLQQISKIEQKQLISQNLKIQILTEVQAKYFIQLFQRMSSGELVEKIAHDTQSILAEFVMQAHLKIMHAIIVPYLNRQLSFINVYNYFKYVQKIMPSVNCSPFLLNLVRTLSYFLIDLDQLKLQNFSQLLKTINKLLLILLQVSEPKHILQVLFLMMKQQLKTNTYIKLNLLLPKCIGKVIKNPIFRSQYERQRNGEGNQCIKYIIKQFMQILCGNQIGQDSSLMKTIKNLLIQIKSLFSNSMSICQDILVRNSQNMPQKLQNFLKQLLEDKIKQNTNKIKQNTNPQIYQKPELSYVNSQNSYVQSKQIKNAGNMMKALKSIVVQHVISNNGKKNMQKMGE